MKRVTLDFETRSRLDVTQVGSWRYAEDRSTDIICLAYKIDEGEESLWLPSDGACPRDLAYGLQHGIVVEAHNAGFERAIWACLMIPKYKFPPVGMDQWNCTSARASAMGLPPSLKALGSVLSLKKQKDMEGHNKMMSCARPKFPKKNDPDYAEYDDSEIVWNENVEDVKITCEYCIDDVRSEHELSGEVLELSEDEQEVWRLDQVANDRGFCIDMRAVNIMLDKMQDMSVTELPKLALITDNAVSKPGQVKKIKEWVGSKGVEIPNVQKETIDKLLTRGDLPEPVRAFFGVRQVFSGAAVKKYIKMKNSISPENRVRDTLVYCGAQRTGRWAGKRTQPHNLFKSPISDKPRIDASFAALFNHDWVFLELMYGDLMSAFAALTRSVIIPTPGYDMYVADFAAVEARVVFWLADETQALAEIRKGICQYKSMAATLYHKDYETITKDERNFGKPVVLGMGFGMGGNTFYKQCESRGMDMSKYSIEFVRAAVKAYRRKYPKVTAIWDEFEDKFKACITHGINSSLANGKIVMMRHEKYISIRLPSGRKLFYWYPKIIREMKTFYEGQTPVMADVIYVQSVAKNGSFRTVDTYGAKIWQNCVQGVARDLTAHSIKSITNEGYKLLWTTHDELIAEGEKDSTFSLEGYCKTTSGLPKWAVGLLMGVDGFVTNRYRKD